MSDERFDIHLNLRITKSDGTLYATGDQNWHDIGYDGVVAVQSALLQALETLHRHSFVHAHRKGLGKRLESLGGDVGDLASIVRERLEAPERIYWEAFPAESVSKPKRRKRKR